MLMRSTIQGWTDDLKARLAIYRQDSSALVTNTVAFIWVSTYWSADVDRR
jgi:hypothetical protein